MDAYDLKGGCRSPHPRSRSDWTMGSRSFEPTQAAQTHADELLSYEWRRHIHDDDDDDDDVCVRKCAFGTRTHEVSGSTRVQDKVATVSWPECGEYEWPRLSLL
jgi:hypothetical protein